MVRIEMSIAINRSLALSQKQKLNRQMTMTQRISLKLYLELQDFLKDLHGKAKKEKYCKHGLDFDFAVISKRQLPKKMLEFGPGFAAFNYSEGSVQGEPMRFLVADYIEDFPPESKELVAVHEYGESLGIGHKEASLLEWSVAKKEGILKQHLDWIERNFPCKAADLEYNSRLYDIMPEEVWASASEKAETDSAAARLLELIKGFDFPPEAREVAERHGALARKVSIDIIRAGNKAAFLFDSGTEQAVFLSAYLFHKEAVRAVLAGIYREVYTNSSIEDSWRHAIDQAAKRYDENRLPSLKALADAMANGKHDLLEQVEALDIPLGYSVPCRYSFALEAARILKQSSKAAREADHTAIMKDKLAVALKLAKGRLMIFDDEGKKESVHLTAFYIKSLLFEATEAYVESGHATELRDKQAGKRFGKAVRGIASEFLSRTGKNLILGSEAALWNDPVRLSRLSMALLSGDTRMETPSFKAVPGKESKEKENPGRRTRGSTIA
jgi:hypothetical protein